jgi:hypothetical protein
VDNTELMKPPYKATFAGGKGEPNDPYQVATAEQLLSIGTSQKLLASHYVLVNWAKCQ